MLGFLVTITLSRSLGPAGLGVYAIATTLIALLLVPIGNGWSTTLLKAAAAGKYNSHWADAKGLAIRGAQIAFAISLLVIAAAYVSRIVFSEASLSLGVTNIVVVGVGFVLFFDQLSALRAGVLRGLDFPVVAQAPEMLVRPIVLFACFSLISWSLNGEATVAHAFYSLIAAAVTSAIAGQFLVSWKAPYGLTNAAPKFDTKSWTYTSAPIALSAGLLSLNAYLGILALGLLANAADVGIYRVAVQVSLVSGLAYTSLNLIASQRFAHFRASNDQASAQVIATTMARIATILSIPFLLILVFVGNRIVPYLFGDDFQSALLPMIVLALGQCITAATGMAQPLLVMNGLERVVAKWTTLAVLVNIGFCLILIPKYNVVGAATAATIAATFWKIALCLVARQRTGIDTSILGWIGPEEVTKEIQG